MQIAVRHTLQVYDPAEPSLRESEAFVLPVRDAQAVMGETVAAYLARVEWHFDLPTVCRINGECYGRTEWESRPLAVNDNVEFVSRPLGGGSGGSTGKTIMSIVALVALSAVAGPAGTALAGAVGASGFAATAITAATSALIVGAGSMALSYFLKPKSGGKTNSNDALYNFSLQGNASRPMQPIPVLNGRLRFAPDFAAPTYSEYDGDGMTDYALFGITCGRWRPEQVLIGDTPIWNSESGYNPDFPGIQIQFVEPGEQVTLYPVNVVTSDELAGVELSTTFTPGYIVNAAGTITSDLIVDLVWPGGAYHTGEKGKILRADTHVLMRVRAVSNSGAPIGPWIENWSKVYSNTKQSQIRVTERIHVGPGRWQVSMRRVNEATASDNGTDAVTWTALRAHIEGPQAFPRVSVMALKGVASKQLSGVSGGQIRVIGTRILPVWRDGQFVEEPTRSIAWAALDWWRNSDYAAGLSISDVDFPAFVQYDALWSALGHTFDRRTTEVQNLDDILETVLKAGRAFPAPVGDKLTITREEPRGLPRMLFTENDIVRDSLEIDYALSDQAWADGIVGEYVDQDTWRLAEVSSAPDGVVLLNPARVQLEGIVNRKQAMGMVRFMAAESQYRRINVSWIARMEGRLLKRGSLVKLSSDEPETWGQSCEVEAASADGLTMQLDPAPRWENGVNHYVEIRGKDGRPWGPVRVTRGASAKFAVINGSDATNVAAKQGTTALKALMRAAEEERAWIAFSPGQPRTIPVLVTEGDPDQDGEHIHLKGVLDAPEVYTTTETGVPPLLQIPDLFSGSMPAIIGLVASISQRQTVLILSAGWQGAKNAATYEAGLTYDGGTSWIEAYRGDRTVFEALVGASTTMRVRVRGLTPSGVPGAWYVTDVIAPDLKIEGDLFRDLTIRIEKLSLETQAEIRAISDLGRGLLTLDQETGNIGIDLSHDTIRGNMRQIAEAVTRLGAAQATETTNAYEARELIKIGNSANYAAIERLDEERLSDNEAFAQITTNLSVRLEATELDIVGTATAVQGLTTSVTNIDGRVTAQSQSITGLSSRIEAGDLKLSGQATAVQGLTTRVDATENGIISVAQSVTSLQSTIKDQGDAIIGNAQAVETLTTTVTKVDGKVSAQASSLQALGTTVGDHTATLTTYGTSIDGIKVQYGVTGEINGQTGGFTLTGVRRVDGGASFSLNIRADVFVDGALTARVLSAENLIVKSAQIGDLVVSTRAVGYRQITNMVPVVSTTMTAEVTITPRDGSYIRIDAQAINAPSSELPDNTPPGGLYILRNGDFNQQINYIPNNSTYTGTGTSRRTRIFSQTIIGFDMNPTPGVPVKYTVVNNAGANLPGIVMTVQEFAR